MVLSVRHCSFSTTHLLMQLYPLMHCMHLTRTKAMVVSSTSNMTQSSHNQIWILPNVGTSRKWWLQVVNKKGSKLSWRSKDSTSVAYKWNAALSVSLKALAAAWHGFLVSKMIFAIRLPCLRSSSGIVVMNASFYQKWFTYVSCCIPITLILPASLTTPNPCPSHHHDVALCIHPIKVFAVISGGVQLVVTPLPIFLTQLHAQTCPCSQLSPTLLHCFPPHSPSDKSQNMHMCHYQAPQSDFKACACPAEEDMLAIINIIQR